MKKIAILVLFSTIMLTGCSFSGNHSFEDNYKDNPIQPHERTESDYPSVWDRFPSDI